MVRNRRISLKNAKELMLEYTASSIRDPKKAAEMFAEDGASEMPYLATFGIPSQYRGRDAIVGFFQSVLDLYPGIQFENIKVLIDTPDQAFGEFESTSGVQQNGTIRSSAHLCAPGCREWKDQAVERGTEYFRSGPSYCPG
jgi:hypothetical protein